MAILLAVLLTALLTLVLLNLSTGEKKVQERIEPLYSVHEPQFLRSMGSLLGPSLMTGNRITRLRNGVQIFPAMLDAIAHAEESITFETFIYWSGTTGTAFAEALTARARAGVSVHVLIDWVGSSKMDRALLATMEDAGVEVRRYHPPRWYTLGRLNNRTHRKLLVIDGRVGFTGGVGIADPWRGNAEDPDHWRDSHFRVDGPVVAQMQSAFLDNWTKASGEVLHDAHYFPPLKPLGPHLAQMFRSGSGEGSESVRLMYLLSIASARQHIRIAAAYFVPDDLSVATLIAASVRGVTVQVLVPGPYIDTAMTRRASRARWGPLLEAGIEIHEYQPTMFHCKVMIVDGVWTSVGSTNFDSRSFRLNDEANLNIHDAEFAAAMVEDFEADLTRARQVTLEAWRARPRREKLIEHAAALLRSQL